MKFEVGKSYVAQDDVFASKVVWKCVHVWEHGRGLLVYDKGTSTQDVRESEDPVDYEEYKVPRKVKRWVVWLSDDSVILSISNPSDNYLVPKHLIKSVREIELTEGEGL